MKKILSLLFFTISMCLVQYAVAQCGNGFKKVEISIIPDSYPTETTWGLHDDISGALIDTGGSVGDTICVDSARCLRFTIYDQYGDGICCTYGQGSYTVKLNGVQVARGDSFHYSQSNTFNCLASHSCSNALTAYLGSQTAPSPETWYLFIPNASGLYSISTCNQGNNCNTKLYIYDHCPSIYTNDQQGTIFYNDNGCGTSQAVISGALQIGVPYYIRVGEGDTTCLHHGINWQISYMGAISGCMDPLSCNYDPLATISDSSCIYPPNVLCPAPDLAVDQGEVISTLYMTDMNVTAGDCYVNEGCLGGYGTRRLLNFSTHIRNIGNQDYFIGVPDSSSNQFVWDPCHGHFHYVGYAEYLLFDTAMQQIRTGFKNGFCVLDLECGGGGIGKFNCGNMGITVGCGDIYSSGLPCQWLDVTDVDTGTYTMVVRVNWNRKPDKLGYYELNYDNNWAQVCLHLYLDSAGAKQFTVLPNCPVFVDCAGDTFGSAQQDCAGVCGGSATRGDLNQTATRDTIDMLMYLNGITNDTLAMTPCNDLNGDGVLTVADAARLNGCLRHLAGTLTTLSDPQSVQHLCEFPYNIVNPFDTVRFSVANVDWQHHYMDLSVYNRHCKVMGYQLKVGGCYVDSVKNLALGNYLPPLRSAQQGYITELSNENDALYTQPAPLNFLRVYFSHMVDSTICLAQVVDVVNQNYQQVIGVIDSACKTFHTPPIIDTTDTTHHVGVIEILTEKDLQVIPNPTTGNFDLFVTNQSLYGALVRIYNSVGMLVYETHNEGLSNKMQFDLSALPSGVYLVQVGLQGSMVMKRVLLAR